MASDPPVWNAENRRVGTVYMLHFTRPYYHARHYLGFATKLERRLINHLSGRGSPLVRAVVEAGIEVFLARRWDQVTSKLERRGHDDSGYRLATCPICSGPRAYGRLIAHPDEVRPGWHQTVSTPSHLIGPLEVGKLRAAARRIQNTASPGATRPSRLSSERYPGANT